MEKWINQNNPSPAVHKQVTLLEEGAAWITLSPLYVLTITFMMFR